MADKTAEAMAKAMGLGLASEESSEPAENIPASNESGENQNQEDQENQNGGDETENDTGSQNEESSSEEQPNEEVNPSDQGEASRIIPGSDEKEQVAGQEIDFEALLAERSNGRFNSLADIDKALEEAPQSVFANEQVAKINEYVKQGGKLEDFVKTQTVDYTQMNPAQLVKEHMMMTEGLTSEEADLMIDADYGISSDASERDRKLAEIKMKRASKTALNYLQDNQQKWATPNADMAARQEAIDKKWLSDLDTATQQVKSLDIALNQTDKFSYTVEPATLSKIKAELNRPEAFFRRYINKDGTENVKQFVEDMVKLNQFDAIVRSAAANNKAKGKEEVIRDIKNPNFEGKSKQGQEKGQKSIIQQAAEAIYGTK